ncbi:unnamed protein product, partial [Prorocentrum cordatum]
GGGGPACARGGGGGGRRFAQRPSQVSIHAIPYEHHPSAGQTPSAVSSLSTPEL